MYLQKATGVRFSSALAATSVENKLILLMRIVENLVMQCFVCNDDCTLICHLDNLSSSTVSKR